MEFPTESPVAFVLVTTVKNELNEMYWSYMFRFPVCNLLAIHMFLS